MPYSENNQLPEPVRNSLGDSDQTKWREVFNSALSGTCAGDDGCAARVAWSAVKKEARLIEGWASTDALDKQGDVVEPEAFEKTMGRFMSQGGLLIDKHSSRKIGAVIDWALKETEGKRGLWVKAVIYHQYQGQDEVWKRIQEGGYKAFSIGADPLKIGRVCDEEKCWNTIKDLELFEISVVDRPANPEATIEAKTLAKGESFLNKRTTSDNNAMAELTSPVLVERCAMCKAYFESLRKAGVSEAEALQKVETAVIWIKKQGGTIEVEEKKGGEGAVVPPVVKDEIKQEPQAPTANPMEAMMTVLQEIKALLTQKPVATCDQPKKPEEMKVDLGTPEAKAAIEAAVKSELVKMGASKEAATPRPDLQKHEPDGNEITKILNEPDKLGKISWQEAVELTKSSAGKGGI